MKPVDQKFWHFALFVFLWFFLISSIKDVRFFIGDASNYWELAQLDGLDSFKSSIRGVWLPIIFSFPRWIGYKISAGDSQSILMYIPFRFFNAAFFAFAFCYVFPRFFSKILKFELSGFRLLVPPVLFSIFFQGFVFYPLSDFYAFTFFVLGLYFLVLADLVCFSVKKNYLLIFLSGFFLYLSYNVRTIYLFPVLGVCAYIIITSFVHQSYRFSAAAVFVFGLLFSSLSQGVINYSISNNFSPLINTSRNGKSLFVAQLYWGLTVQRYETNIDPTHKPTVFYMDSAGKKIFDNEDILNSDVNLNTYIDLMTKYPLEIMGIFTRHIFNGLDVRDGDLYTTVRSKEKIFVPFFSWFFLILGFYSLALTIVRSSNTRNQLSWLFLLFLPVFMIIPGAVETRFFLSMSLVLYYAFASKLYVGSEIFRGRSIVVAIVFAIVFNLIGLMQVRNFMYEIPKQYLFVY